MRIIRPITLESLDLTLDSSSIPETPPAAYNAGTTYAVDDRVSVTTGTVSLVYESKVGSNTGNTPASSPTQWRYLATTYSVYAGGTTYALDDIVISTTDHHEYQSLQASNTGHSLSDTAWWLDLGSNNRYRMFDQSNSSITENGQEIDVTLSVTGRADSVSLLNLLAATVQIIMTTVADGEIFNETYDLVSDSGINNWYEYFFEDVIRRGDLVVYDLPLNADPTIQIIITDPNGTASVGSCVIGQSRDLGLLVYGARTGIQDYSRKQADEFGNFTIVQRAFSKRASFKIVVENAKVDAISALLASYRATPCVYVGVDDFTSTWVYGFYRDFAIEIAHLQKSYLTLELEGLT
jgi:hypothetical protein